MIDNHTVGIIGEGSWATAMIKILQQNVKNINWLVRDTDMAKQIKETSHNPLYLSDVEINNEVVTISSSTKNVIQNSDIIFIILPSAFIESSLTDITENDFKNKIVFSATKGMISSCNKTVCSYLNNYFKIPYSSLGFVSGPSHAEEVALERLTFLTVLSENNNNSELVCKMLNCRYIKTITSNDVIGAEYSTVLKNIMAIAAGVCHGLGYGDNFQSVLTSNAIREINNFLNIVAPLPNRNLLNYVYLGDLLVTCYSQFSRNRTLGTMVGKGYTVKSAQLEMNMIAEGYYAANSIINIAKENNIEMPITQAVYRILYEKYSPVVEMKLLTNNLK